MNITDLKKSWSGLQEETKAYKKLCVGLIAANIILGCFLFTKETTVVMQPWTLTQTAQLENKAASRSYKEAWALAIAEMLGNLTPNNVDFVVDRLRPLLDPSIYNEVVRDANEQALSLKEDRIAQSFLPRSVEYEPATNKCFVRGQSIITGASGSTMEKNEKAQRKETTYEFEISVNNYLPVIRSIQVYEGGSRTEKVLKRMEQSQKRKQEREAKRREREED